jgi:hypothetical protein
MAFEFLTDLQEARMTRNSNNQRMLTYTDCKERAFLIVMMLYVMAQYKSHRNVAAQYAYKTVMYREYTRFRIDGSDLYNLFYFITGDETALGKLKDPGSASIERKKTFISIGKVNGMLRAIGSNEKPGKAAIEIITKLEKDLNITNNDYKTLRRRLSFFDTDTPKERQLTVTRLMFAARAKLSDADFIVPFSAFTNDKNLEDLSKTNPEMELSVPDGVSQTDVINYRFLVPVTKLPFIAKFLDNAKAGRSVVANFVQAYVPIIMMIDDIVSAGPVYVEQLKQLHKRAKNARK